MVEVDLSAVKVAAEEPRSEHAACLQHRRGVTEH